jgi:hypothetical protein
MAKKSSKLNGQEYQPPYQFWHEPQFWADECVSRGMTWLQRHFYRALLQSAFYSSTRPYLPISDDELWILADAGTKQNWIENKDAILVKFQEKTLKGDVKVLSHKRLMRDWIKLIQGSEKQSQRRRGKTTKRGKPTVGKPSENDGDSDIEANEDEL